MTNSHNSKFVYCFDQEYSNKLKSQNFKLIKMTKIDNQDCWIFENNKDIKNLQFDHTKTMFSNKLTF